MAIKFFDALIFDLDGTLIDSVPDVRANMNKVLVAGGRREVSIDDIKSAVGWGGRELVERSMIRAGKPGTPDEIDEQLAAFLASYAANPVEHTVIYPGVQEVLENLRGDGIAMGICTNKPTATAMPVLDATGLGQFFSVVSCGDVAKHKKPDGRHILDVIEQLNATAKSSAMIGDSETDIDAALDAGVKSVAVTFGYAHRPHHELGADAVIDHFFDLPQALKNVSGGR